MQTYSGGCHCGNIRYEVDSESLSPVISCNCSICAKRGWLLSFVPATQFRLIQGAYELTDYQFNKKRIHHLFCKTCGVSSFCTGTAPDGTETIGINVHCLDDVDTTTFAVTSYDGKHM
jgi:hypothetical protein